MKTVQFKYGIYQSVKTPLSNGIVTMLGYDDSGVSYYVKTSQQGVDDAWWPEGRVEAILTL